jgi:hypothetical protein
MYLSSKYRGKCIQQELGNQHLIDSGAEGETRGHWRVSLCHNLTSEAILLGLHENNDRRALKLNQKKGDPKIRIALFISLKQQF